MQGVCACGREAALQGAGRGGSIGELGGILAIERLSRARALRLEAHVMLDLVQGPVQARVMQWDCHSRGLHPPPPPPDKI